MTGGPHPIVMMLVTEQRHTDLRAEADRDRCGQTPRHEVNDLPPLIVLGLLVAVLALLLLAQPAMA